MRERNLLKLKRQKLWLSLRKNNLFDKRIEKAGRVALSLFFIKKMIMEEKLSALRAKIAYTKMLVDANRAKASTLADLVCELEGMERGAGVSNQVSGMRREVLMEPGIAPTIHGLKPMVIEKVVAEQLNSYGFKPVVSERVDRRPNYMSVPMNIILAKKADLMKEIDRLRKIEGARSNKLALVPDDEDAPDECDQLVLGRLEIERLYDQYYYIERTGQLPDTVEAEKEVDPEIELKKFKLADDIKSAKNIIYKEGQKLKNIASYTKKNREEAIETINDKIARYEAELERLEVERRML
jgi:hypothetical protein